MATGAVSNSRSSLFKVVMIGDSGVGKSCLMLRFADDAFSDQYVSTIGVDYRFKTIKVGSETFRLQVWDSAGQEKFRSIVSSYYKGADGIIMVFDVTSRESFEHIADWLEDLKQHIDDGTRLLLVGNKNDASNREVPFSDAKEYAASIDVPFIETSARTGSNVTAAFAQLTKELAETADQRTRERGSSLGDPDEGVRGKKCCR